MRRPRVIARATLSADGKLLPADNSAWPPSFTTAPAPDAFLSDDEDPISAPSAPSAAASSAPTPFQVILSRPVDGENETSSHHHQPPGFLVLPHPFDDLFFLPMLADLRKRHRILRILTSSPALIRSLLACDLIDEWLLHISPVIIGGKNTPTLTGPPGDFLPTELHFRLKTLSTENNHAYCHYIRRIPR